MTGDLRPGLQPLSHLKASPTTSSSSSTALPSSSVTKQPSPIPRRSRLRKDLSRGVQVDATNDKATTTLIRRVLCPQAGNYGASTPQPLEELLPPLTSSNDVDRQLYALIAIIVKEFIYSWYSKLTSDQNLINEVLQVIAHCTRALEQRLRQIDTAQLLLDEIPSLVDAHITSYRLAKQQPDLSGLSSSSRNVYHTLDPHPGLSPIPDPSNPETIVQQLENEAIYRQLLAQGALAVLLPTEDLENVCLRTLVCDIIADLILGNEVSARMCEGRFLWEIATKMIETRQKKAPEVDKETDQGQEDQLKKFGLLSNMEEPKAHLRNSQSQVLSLIWSLLNAIYLAYVGFCFVAMGLVRVTSTPSASRSTPSCPPSHGKESPGLSGDVTGKRAVLNYRLYGMISQVLDVPRRMPWLTGMLALIQYIILAGPGRLGDTDNAVDRFLHETIDEYLLTPTLLPNLLRTTRAALFPGNARPTPTPNRDRGGGLGARADVRPSAVSSSPAAPSPHVSVQAATSTPPPAEAVGVPSNATDKSNTTAPVSTPSELETATIKRRCALRILSLVPTPVARSFWSPSPVNIHNSNRPYDRNADPNANDNANDDNTNDAPPELNNSNLHNPSTPNPVKDEQQNQNEVEEEIVLETIESDILDLFEDEYCNKHLIYAIIERVLVRLLPELQEKSIRELLEDRGVGLSADVSFGEGEGES